VIKLVNEDLAREVVTRGGEFCLNFQDGARWFNMDYQPRGGALVRGEVVYDEAAILEVGEAVRAVLQYGVTNAHLYNEHLLVEAAAAAPPAPLHLSISQFEQMSLSDGSGGGGAAGGGGMSPGRQQRLLVVSRTSSLSRQPSVSSVAEEDEDDDEDDEQEGREEEKEVVGEEESQAAADGGGGGKIPILGRIPLPPRPPRKAASGGGGISPWRNHRDLEYDRLIAQDRQQLHHLIVAMKYDPHTLDRQPGDEEVDAEDESRYDYDEEGEEQVNRKAMYLKGKFHKGREKAKNDKNKGNYYD